MIIRGFDSMLPPPDGGKGADKKPLSDKTVMQDRIDVSTQLRKQASSIDGNAVIGSARTDKVRPENLGFSSSAGDRIEISSATQNDKLSLIRSRIAEGYYNDPRNIEKLADILIDKLDLNGTEN